MTPKLANPNYTPIPHPSSPYPTFSSFYPFYLGEHSHPLNRTFHLLGTSVSLLTSARIVLAVVPLFLPSNPHPSRTGYDLVGRLKGLDLGMTPREALWLFLKGLGVSYAFAWVGHFWVERNRPATFKYPLFSLRGDLKMLWEIVSMQRALL